MRVNFEQVIVDKRDGKPFLATVPVKGEYLRDPHGNLKYDRDGNRVPLLEDKELTVKLAAMTALTFPFPDDKAATPEEKRRRAKIVEKICESESGEVDLELRDVAVIQECVDKYYGGLVMLQVERLLEGKA